MCEWRSKFKPDYQCKAPTEPGSKYCIFHEPGEKDIEKFKEKLYEQIDQPGLHGANNHQFDFRGYVFPVAVVACGGSRERQGLVLPKEIPERLNCQEVVARERMDFSFITTKGLISFRHAVFEDSVNFTSAEIGGRADFCHARFMGSAFFSYATFQGHISFDETFFNWGVSFYQALVNAHAAFWKCTSGAAVSLDRILIRDDLSFREARIKGVLGLRRALIEGNVYFEEGTIGKLRLSGATIEGKADFSGMVVTGTADFTTSIFRRVAVFSNVRFLGKTLLAGTHASGIDLGPGRPTTIWSPSGRQGLHLLHHSTRPFFWHFARRAFESEGKPREADAAYYFERVSRLTPQRVSLYPRSWHLRNVPRVFLRILILVFQWLPDCLFLRWPTAYGASLARLFATWAVLIGAFTSAYYVLCRLGVLLFDASSPGLEFPFSFGRALYFSVITFTTLGYGDIRPAPPVSEVL